MPANQKGGRRISPARPAPYVQSCRWLRRGWHRLFALGKGNRNPRRPAVQDVGAEIDAIGPLDRSAVGSRGAPVGRTPYPPMVQTRPGTDQPSLPGRPLPPCLRRTLAQGGRVPGAVPQQRGADFSGHSGFFPGTIMADLYAFRLTNYSVRHRRGRASRFDYPSLVDVRRPRPPVYPTPDQFEGSIHVCQDGKWVLNRNTPPHRGYRNWRTARIGTRPPNPPVAWKVVGAPPGETDWSVSCRRARPRTRIWHGDRPALHL